MSVIDSIKYIVALLSLGFDIYLGCTPENGQIQESTWGQREMSRGEELTRIKVEKIDGAWVTTGSLKI